MKHMSTITTKGQVTLPKEFRDALGLKPGDRVAFTKDGDGVRVTRARELTRGQKTVEAMRNVKGFIRGMTTDQILRETRGDDWPRR